jgi:CheY-like chemotaxis protein
MDEEDVRLLAPMAPGAWVKLSVSDSGMGMDEATQCRVFEPFFTTKASGEGTGLGLSTVYGIVKQSGGFIWISSTLGHGTTIDIYFPPTKDNARPVEEVVEVRGAPTGSETILLVEDEDAVRSLVARTLRKSGYVVIEASNGREALRVAERHDGLLDLILTDVVMPRMSGPELVERLAPAHPATRVLYMSGYTADAFVGHGGLQPGTLLLQKPFSPTELAHKVRAVLSEPREAREYAYATSN